MTDDTRSRAIATVAQTVGVDEHEVTDASTAKDLGADSLDQTEIILGIEKEFGISITDADAGKLKDLP